ncbi:MAG: hypothetical protein SWK76_17030 [Actinomycetota bacterium]|nr:hypothetical protein [Actinomycetota bacterium]
MMDLYHDLGVVHLLDPQDVAHADTVSEILDRKGFDGACVCAVVGALTGVDVDNYLTPVLQESDSVADADFSDVAAADMTGAFAKIDAATEDQVTQLVGYIGRKRYIRVKFGFTGTGITAALIAALGVLGHARDLPATAPDPVTAT